MKLQAMELPNGRFILVLSGDNIPVDDDLRAVQDLKEPTGACAVLVVTEPIEVLR